jgi:curved DNA-binding protein CbpA
MKLEVACEVLGLQFQAGSRPSDEDAKRAYRTLALANHPDKVRLLCDCVNCSSTAVLHTG